MISISTGLKKMILHKTWNNWLAGILMYDWRYDRYKNEDRIEARSICSRLKINNNDDSVDIDTPDLKMINDSELNIYD